MNCGRTTSARPRRFRLQIVTAPTPDSDLTREELEELVRTLREQVASLREELRRSRRDQHETPPHYL